MISENFKKRTLTSIALIILIILIFINEVVLLFTLLVMSNLSIIEFSNIIKKITQNKIKRLIFNFIFIIYLFLFCLIFYILWNYLNSKVYLFLILICCAASDIGGYVFGKVFKGAKLTKISPKKTISGSLGSIFFSIIILQIIFFQFFSVLSIDILLIGLFVSIACQIGDIFFSYLKRKAKIKDTGNFLPGHGGILDRVDGIIIGIPAGLITAKILL